MEIKLIRAAQIDLPFLLDLRIQTMEIHLQEASIQLSEEEHLACVEEHFDCAYLIICQEETVGLLKCRETDSAVEIMQFQILPAHQGKGIGRLVLDQVKTESKQLHKPVILSVLKANHAQQLYLRNGFVQVGEDDLEYHFEWRP